MAGFVRNLLSKLTVFLLAPISAAQQEPITYVPVPGSPFRAIFSADGQHLFVSEDGGIGILNKSADGVWSYVRKEPLPNDPTGIRLTDDEKVLIAPTDDGVVFLDEAKIVGGTEPAKIGAISYGKSIGPLVM